MTTIGGGFFSGIFSGFIQEVLPPSDDFNETEYQYEYMVTISTDLGAQVPVRCVKMDYGFGGIDGYEDEILGVGHTVFVMFPNTKGGCGLIMGGSRNSINPVVEAGVRWRKRFKTIDQMVDKNGNYIVAYKEEDATGPNDLSSFGPNVIIEKDHVRIQSGDGQDGAAYAGGLVDSIIIHGDTRTISIITENWNVRVAKNCTIFVEGDCDIKAKNLTAIIANSADIKAGELSAKVLRGAKIDVMGNADINALQINLNGKLGGVITTATQPTCYVTGIPFNGSKTVKAGL